MTRNEIALQEARTKEQANRIAEGQARETQRSNRKREQLEATKIATGAVSNIIGSALKAVNDPSWYKKDPQAVLDAANISYEAALGTYMPWIQNSVDVQASIGGIMSIPVALTYGPDHRVVNAVDYDIINIAAKNLYSFVRHANSGSANYDTPDLMEYIIAMDTIVSAYAHLVKVLGIVNKYDRRNRYLAKALVESCGVNFDDLQNNLSDFRLFVNNLGTRLASFNIPATFPLYARHLWMFSHLWKDRSCYKGQIYHFVPGFGYEFEGKFGTMPSIKLFSGDYTVLGTATNTGSDARLTFAAIKAKFNSLIDGLLDNEDIGIMSGDILKAYGEDAMLKFDSFNSEFIIDITAVDEVLSQIMNADIINLAIDQQELKITQTGQRLEQKFMFLNQLVGHSEIRNVSTGVLSATVIDKELPDGAYYKHYLNMFTDSVSPDDNMVASRLCAYITTNDEAPADRGGWYVATAGTEVCYAASVYVFLNSNGTQLLDVFPFGKFMTVGDLYTGSALTINENINYPFDCVGTVLSQFDWLPKYYILDPKCYVEDEESASPMIPCAAALVFEFGNYAITDYRVISNMHNVAILSLLAIPDIGNKLRVKPKR